MRSILILGGTTEARMLAMALASRADLSVTLSLAGRTEAPARMAVPVRVGGFGGVAGLRDWMQAAGTGLLIDATHPFAARISHNAAAAARAAGIAAFALRRPAWVRGEGYIWHDVADAAAGIAALGAVPRRVFLALGRQEAHVAEAAPQHQYLVRSIDPVVPPVAVPHLRTLLARGPFGLEEEIALLRTAGIDAILCKNSGGDATRAKIDAARMLGIPVMMIRRPAVPPMPTVSSVAEAVAMVDHDALRGA